MAVKNSSETAGARTPAGRPRSSVATILFTALGVLVIAACAVVLSYNGIYRIAVQGNVEPRYSHLYPAVFTLLVLMALWTGYTLRTAPRAQRLWADGLILLLVAVAAGASALEASDLVLVPAVATVAAAVAPWLALLVAFRLFLSVVMHLRGEVPGTGPRRVRRRRAGDAPEPAAEPHSADPPDGEPGTERDRSFAASFGAPDAPEPGRETAPATASADEHADEHADRAVADGDDGEDGEDGRAPRPRAPESADFRDPALRPPRPAPVERPSRPERPSSLEPPESAQEPDPDPQRTRRGFLGRRSDGAGRQQAPAAGTPAEADGAAEGPAESGSPGDGGPTDEAAPLWTDTADAGSETVGAAPEPARPAPAAHEGGEDGDDFPFEDSPDAAGPGSDRREPASGDAAPETPGSAETGPGPAGPDAGETAAEADTAAAGARTRADASELPTRTPGTAENPIKRAADSPPVPGSAGSPPAEPAAAAEAGPVDDADGFVHELPLGDPTNDEAESPAPAADTGSSGSEDGPGGEDGSVSEGGRSGADAFGPPEGGAYPAAPPIGKRPMVLKPRRTRQDGASSPFPEDPPSNRVRSQPRPPEE